MSATRGAVRRPSKQDRQRTPPWKAPQGFFMMVWRDPSNTFAGSWPTWVGAACAATKKRPNLIRYPRNLSNRRRECG